MTGQSLFREDVEPEAGAVITEIAPLPSDPNMRRVKVGRRVIARLPSGAVEQLELRIGQRWTDALAKHIAEAVAITKARRDAMTLLGRRAFSRGEVVERLIRRDHSEAVANRVADELQHDHWIDDEAYATALAEEFAQRKSASHRLIVEKLVHRKISEDIAANAARRVLAEVDPIEAAVDFARKRLAQMKGLDRQRAARRISGALARRGFDEETINEALRRMGLV